MSSLLLCMSHTPLMGLLQPEGTGGDEAAQAITKLKDQLTAFEPELVFLFGPDHFNGFFYDLMPPFCIGAAATSIGDYGGFKGPLNVPSEIATACVDSLLRNEIDCALSWRMQVDHGFAQPLALLGGAAGQFPVVPVFINCVAPPLPTMKRARVLGDAIGRYAQTLDRRVAFIASGGLSHNPPVPTLEGASPELAERLIAGRNPGPEQRALRESRTLQAARDFASGESPLTPLNPDWDHRFLTLIERGDWAALDQMANADITRQAGASAHEVKTWVAAAAAMQSASNGFYRAKTGFYRPIPEWIAGFATLCGETAA